MIKILAYSLVLNLVFACTSSESSVPTPPKVVMDEVAPSSCLVKATIVSVESENKLKLKAKVENVVQLKCGSSVQGISAQTTSLNVNIVPTIWKDEYLGKEMVLTLSERAVPGPQKFQYTITKITN